MPALKFKKRVKAQTPAVATPEQHKVVITTENLFKSMSAETEPVMEKVTSYAVPTIEGVNDLYRAAKVIQDSCSDSLIPEVNKHNCEVYFDYSPTTNMAYPLLMFTDNQNSGVFSKSQTQKMTDYAFSQLCGKLGVPVRYMQKCLQEQPNLMCENLNTWLSAYGRDLFIRSYDNKVRGVLSSRYSVFDTPDIVDVLSDITAKRDLKVKSYFISPERFHARLITSEPLNVPDKDIFAGITVDSSDVGRSVLKVMFFIYKQVCTNGLCVEKGKYDLFTQKHLKICTDDFREGLSSSLENFPILIEEMEDCISKAHSNNTLLSADSRKEPETYTRMISQLMERIKNGVNLSDESAEKVITLLDRYGHSDWGVINALTEVAQDYTLEKRIEIEKYAGRLLMRTAA